MTKLLMLMAAVFAAAILSAEETPAVTGTWNMGLQGGDHVVPVAMVLQQEGKKVSGTIAVPSQQRTGQAVDVEMAGEIIDGALAISGTLPGAAEPTTIVVTAVLKDDGSLEGTATVGNHKMSFTAERLKERK